jgi:F0F1-type ATP synthase membrane subunit b/b'
MNNRKLLLHLVCFGLYLLTLVFIFYRMVLSAFETKQDKINSTINWATLSNVVFFFMMGALLAILYKLGD